MEQSLKFLHSPFWMELVYQYFIAYKTLNGFPYICSGKSYTASSC